MLCLKLKLKSLTQNPFWTAQDMGVYRPRFKLNPHVLRVPIVPGSDPRVMLGDCAARGVRGIVLEVIPCPKSTINEAPTVANGRRAGLEQFPCGVGALVQQALCGPELSRAVSRAGVWRRQHARLGAPRLAALAAGSNFEGHEGVVKKTATLSAAGPYRGPVMH